MRNSDKVPLNIRVCAYFGAWLFLLIGLEIFITPEDLSRTSDSVITRHFLCIPETPLIVLIGLATLMTYPHGPTETAFVLSAGLLLLMGASILYFTQRRIALVLMGIHVILLATAVIYYVRFCHLINVSS